MIDFDTLWDEALARRAAREPTPIHDALVAEQQRALNRGSWRELVLVLVIATLVSLAMIGLALVTS